jgi:putative ABC transport system substrate-binding protein
MPVIGFLNTQSPETFAPFVTAFRQGLSETGYTEGQNVAIEFRWANGRYEQLAPLVAELVDRRVTVIAATGGEPAASAARAASATIPIVFLVAGDPVKLGLVASYNRPGGNATGAVVLTTSLDPKRLSLLGEMLPRSARVAFLVNPNFPDTETRERLVMEAARTVGHEIVVLSARNEKEIDKLFDDLGHLRVDALLVAGDPFFNSRRDQIIALAARHAVPAMYEWREFAAAGGLMSYGAQLPQLYREIGQYTGRILKGEKPGDLPVTQPTKFELVINLKTARALNIKISDKLLSLADEVIE